MHFYVKEFMHWSRYRTHVKRRLGGGSACPLKKHGLNGSRFHPNKGHVMNFCRTIMGKISENRVLQATASLLGGGFKHFWNFHPYLGKISNLTNIFQMG